MTIRWAGVHDTDTSALLDAGAVLPLGAPASQDDTVDTLTARAYRHPLLAERTVVRLVPAALGPAEDLAVEFLDFAPPAQSPAVGVVQQRALGFPAWALVSDPDNGRHALALVKDIERLTRMARSRTGAAKEGFDELGERLARAVPHFLPTFYEEAGRAFAAADSPSYAAMMFGKARAAEQQYALRVDEERQHAVFLEFALAGALTVKALSAYARELAASCPPAVAYERYRRLSVERCLGGLPPYAAMHTDLRRLAKAAGLDQGRADREVLAEVIMAPAVHRAPGPFWTAYRAALTQLARDTPSVRGRLLGMIPNECADRDWLRLLEESGATAGLTMPADALPPEEQTPDGPAGWLSRFSTSRVSGYNRRWHRLVELHELVTRMLPRLIGDARPVRLAGSSRLDLDLADLCLSEGVPLVDPPQWLTASVCGWFKDDQPGARDLAAVAADPRFLPLITAGVEKSLRCTRHGEGDAVERLRAVPGLAAATSHLLAELAETIVTGGLPSLGGELDRVKLLACPQGLAANPAAAQRINDHDLGAVLGRTLRTGLLDELGWPAWEQAAQRVVTAGKRDDKVEIHHQWPYVLLRRGDLILVAGPDGIELEHLIRIPAAERDHTWSLVFRYVDGQLLVSWHYKNGRRGYWSGSPDDIFDAPRDAFVRGDVVSLPVPGGGRTAGGRPLRVGDQAEQTHHDVISDGRTYWVFSSADGQQRWTEFDPATGEQGRVSLPAFVEDGAVDGEPLLLSQCRLRPAPITDSPLGVRDGLVGWRVRKTSDDRFVGEGVDGRRVVSRPGLRTVPYGALIFPGADQPIIVTTSQSYRSATITLSTEDGFVLGEYPVRDTTPTWAGGTVLVPPAAGWHYLRARDPLGSATLRAITDEQATELLTAAAGQETGQLRTLVAERLPQLRDPGLQDGVAGVLHAAAKLAEQLDELVEQLHGAQVTASPTTATPSRTLPSDSHLYAALNGLITYCSARGSSALTLLHRSASALTAAVPPTTPVELGGADLDWYDAFGLVPMAMVRAAAPLTPAEHRDALTALLDLVATSGLTAPGSRLRRLVLQGGAAANDQSDQYGQVWQIYTRRVLVIDGDEDDAELIVLEFSPDGAAGPVPGFTITSEEVLLAGAPSPVALGAFLDRLRSDGPPPARPELADELSRSAGMTHAEALVLLAGLPARGAWDTAEPVALQAAGLDHPGVAQARVTWGAQPAASLARILGLLGPDDPTALWTRGPEVERVAAFWVERHGARTPVADSLVATVHRASLAVGMTASELVHGIANPRTCRWLAAGCEGIDVDDVVLSMAKALPWLAYHLPAGDPLRSALPVAAEQARAWLAEPALSIPFGYLQRTKLEDLAAAVGAAPVTTNEETVVGPYLLRGDDTNWHRTSLRPALLSGGDDPALPAAGALHIGGPVVAALRALLDGRVAAAVASSTAGADEVPVEPQDPSRSRPDLVTEAAGKLGVSADAATLYLQLLALPDPTDRSVARWTGWKPARLKAARAELAGTDLVVEAKRPRAGRTLFLPGGWLAMSNPRLPLELWKKPLMLLDDDGEWLLGLIVPAVAVPQLFEQAWHRVADGDGPRFEQLVTGRRR